MNAGAEKDYKFGNKNNWRRWQWNRIVEHLNWLKKPIYNATVLYLAGEMDLDRSIALAKGFKPNNLICVETEKETAKMLRMKNNLTINAKLHDVISSWNPNSKIDVVIGDFCAGFNSDMDKLGLGLITNSAFSRSTISINLLRGRDAFSNGIRNQLANHYSDIRFNIPMDKHRAYLFYLGLVSSFKTLCDHHLNEGSPLKERYLKYLLTCEQHAFNSYKSGNLCYDSAVFENVSPSGFYTFLNVDVPFNLDSNVNQSVRRSIAAIKAIRTMRINAEKN